MLKLNLGCADRQIDGFINIDIDPKVKPQMVMDVSRLSFVYKGNVDLIYASHVLEHFGRHKYKSVLKEWYDSLTPGGILRLAVPDFAKVACGYADGTYDLDKLYGFLYGGQRNEFDYHRIAFDFITLKQVLIDTGFTNVVRYDWRKTEHAHVDDYSQCYLPHMDKENGTLLSLNVEATKPIDYQS